ncbi:unnamed protein product [Sphagnum balticum]
MLACSIACRRPGFPGECWAPRAPPRSQASHPDKSSSRLGVVPAFIGCVTSANGTCPARSTYHNPATGQQLLLVLVFGANNGPASSSGRKIRANSSITQAGPAELRSSSGRLSGVRIRTGMDDKWSVCDGSGEMAC